MPLGEDGLHWPGLRVVVGGDLGWWEVEPQGQSQLTADSSHVPHVSQPTLQGFSVNYEVALLDQGHTAILGWDSEEVYLLGLWPMPAGLIRYLMA